MQKTTDEIVEWLREQIDTEKEHAREAKGHLWSQAVAAMDAYQLTLDFILGDKP